MNLRLRLALSVAALSAPALMALPLLRQSAQEQAQAEIFVQGVSALFTPEQQALCEASPRAWSYLVSVPPAWSDDPRARHPPGPRRPPGHEPPTDRQHRPGGPHPGGPPPGGPPPGPGGPGGPMPQGRLPAEIFPYGEDLQSEVGPPLARALALAARGGARSASTRRTEGSHEVLDVLVRTPWQGRCAYLLAQHQAREADQPRFALWSDGLLPVGAVALALLWAVGPLVRRIRQLARQVHASALSGYERSVSVEGSDELTDLARSFNEAASEVRQQIDAQHRREQALRSFLENTTHDLMTPLTVLTGHLAELEECHGGDPGTIKAAMVEAGYIASLVHNLSAAARLDAGEPQIHRSEVSLSEIVERAVSRLRPIARIRGVELEVATPPEPVSLLADMTLLEQAVSNLVQNAVKHNKPGGHVAVVLDALPDARFSLDVIDDGPGIAEDELDRLLRPRERGADARTRDPHGQGLGLAIARRVTEAHGLSLSFRPSEFGGLQVRIEGPVLRQATPSLAPRSSRIKR